MSAAQHADEAVASTAAAAPPAAAAVAEEAWAGAEGVQDASETPSEAAVPLAQHDKDTVARPAPDSTPSGPGDTIIEEPGAPLVEQQQQQQQSSEANIAEEDGDAQNSKARHNGDAVGGGNVVDDNDNDNDNKGENPAQPIPPRTEAIPQRDKTLDDNGDDDARPAESEHVLEQKDVPHDATQDRTDTEKRFEEASSSSVQEPILPGSLSETGIDAGPASDSKSLSNEPVEKIDDGDSDPAERDAKSPSNSEEAPPPPPKSPRHMRYALPIGGPSSRSSSLNNLRSGPSSASLQSVQSSSSAVSGVRGSLAATRSPRIERRRTESPTRDPSRSPQGSSHQGPSSPRRKSSLPRLLPSPSRLRAKTKLRSRGSSDSIEKTSGKHERAGSGSALTPLVEDREKEREREKAFSVDMIRNESSSTDASMTTAREEAETSGSAANNPKVPSAADAVWASPLLAALLGDTGAPHKATASPSTVTPVSPSKTIKQSKASAGRVRRRRTVSGSDIPPTHDGDSSALAPLKAHKRSATLVSRGTRANKPRRPASKPTLIGTDGDDGDDTLKPSAERLLSRTPRVRASASSLMVDGQMFTFDSESSSQTKSRPANGGEHKRSDTIGTSTTSETNTSSDHTTVPAIVSAQNAGLNESMKNPIAAKDEPMIYDEDEIEDLPPPGSYAIHPPSKSRLSEAAGLVLYDEEGQMLKFGSIFESRRTLIIFLRHWLCPFCQMFAQSIQAVDPLPLEKANLDLAVVGQGHWHVTKSYKAVMKIPDFVRVYADPSRKIYTALGMTLRTNDQGPACSRPDYQTMGVMKASFRAIKKGVVDMPLRVPGDLKLLGGEFILGPGLQCSFTHRMVTTRGHLDLPRVLVQAGCDLSLKSPSAAEDANTDGMTRKGRPNSTRSADHVRVRRVAKRLARRAHPSSPRDILASKSKAAAAVAAAQQKDTFSRGQRIASSSTRNFTAPMVMGEHGDYVVAINRPSKMSEDANALTEGNRMVKSATAVPVLRSKPIDFLLSNGPRPSSSSSEQHTAPTRKPPVPATSSASAFAAAAARQNSHTALSNAARIQFQRQNMSTDSMPVLAMTKSDVERGVRLPTTRASLDSPPMDERRRFSPSAASVFEKPHTSHSSTRPSTGSSLPSQTSFAVSRKLPQDEGVIGSRSSSMRDGQAIARSTTAPLQAGQTSSLQSSPSSPMHRGNSQGVPLSVFEKRILNKARGGTPSASTSSSSIKSGKSDSSFAAPHSESASLANGQMSHEPAKEQVYASPLLANMLASRGASARPSTAPSDIGSAMSMSNSRPKQGAGDDTFGEDTDYKRLKQMDVPNDAFAQLGEDHANVSRDDATPTPTQDEATVKGISRNVAAAAPKQQAPLSFGGPLFAALGDRTPKGRVISLHADDVASPAPQQLSDDEEHSASSHSLTHSQHASNPLIAPTMQGQGQGRKPSQLSSRAPVPAPTPAFASILAAEEARKRAGEGSAAPQRNGDGVDREISAVHVVAPSQVAPKPFPGGSALFAGLPAQAQPQVQGHPSEANLSDLSRGPTNASLGAISTNAEVHDGRPSHSRGGSFLDDLDHYDSFQASARPISMESNASKSKGYMASTATISRRSSYTDDEGEFSHDWAPLRAGQDNSTHRSYVARQETDDADDGSVYEEFPVGTDGEQESEQLSLPVYAPPLLSALSSDGHTAPASKTHYSLKRVTDRPSTAPASISPARSSSLGGLDGASSANGASPSALPRKVHLRRVYGKPQSSGSIPSMASMRRLTSFAEEEEDSLHPQQQQQQQQSQRVLNDMSAKRRPVRGVGS